MKNTTYSAIYSAVQRCKPSTTASLAVAISFYHKKKKEYRYMDAKDVPADYCGSARAVYYHCGGMAFAPPGARVKVVRTLIVSVTPEGVYALGYCDSSNVVDTLEECTTIL